MLLLVSAACTSLVADAAPDPGMPAKAPVAPAAKPAPSPVATPEALLGVPDTGIWSDLDEQVQLTLPAGATAATTTALLSTAHHLMVVSVDGFPRKVYPYPLRAGDAAELAPLVTAANTTTGESPDDHDGDGIPDTLDILIGAKKTVLNADAYTEGYVEITYPNGDVPRTMGVCTDVIIRAARNAGVDLQSGLQKDRRAAPRAYPMVKKGNASIDHRRVKTLVPYFKRTWVAHTAAFDDPDDPLRPGDVILMDTFPSRSGPDHIGILSDRIGDSGYPLVINNWTDGYHTTEMDLLAFVPVLQRYRIP